MKQSVLENTFQFSFPNGIDILYCEEKPKIYSIVFTDKDSNNYYYYILLFYEKVNDSMHGSKGSINRNSDNNASDTYYVPISIIISSDYGNIDFFRSLLINFYRIIKFDYSFLNNTISNDNNNNIILNGNSSSINSSIEKEKVLSFQKVELLNYFNFCYELPRPPNASIFTLNLRFDKIVYKFQSLLEIPSNDYCLDVLFNTLEISVIIKLFVALLFEKFIIIISNQNMPLFCICESLRYLMFPFEYSFVYIPNLPIDKKDILDSPVPYLIGINTSEISAQELTNHDFIVCDVGTSTLYGNTTKLKLPFQEEMKIKSRLLLLRSKFKNNFDYIITEDGGTKNDSMKKEEEGAKNNSMEKENEGVDFNLSFSQNVQNIFFSIFRDNMKNIKDYIKNNNFNSQKFLNSFKNEEYKSFFDTIVKTAAFEIFINSMSILDDCNSRKFNLICIYEYYKKNKERLEQTNYYSYSFNIPFQLNQLFKVKDFKVIYDKYNEVSNLIKETLNKELNLSNDKLNNSKNSFKNIKKCYSYLNFYCGKENFISFALTHQNNFLYKNVIKKEMVRIYKEIFQVYYDEENFLKYSNKLISDIRQTLTKTSKKNIRYFNRFSDSNEDIVNAPIKSCCQIYLLIAIFLCSTVKMNIEVLKKSNSNQIGDDIIHSKSNQDNFLSQFKNKTNNKFCLEHLVTDRDNNVHIDNIFIFKLYLFAFHKNKKEFPRNLFFSSLGKYSLEELKKIENTGIIYIDETIQCKIRELENKTYKSPVIKPDIDDIDDDIKSNRMKKLKQERQSDLTTMIQREFSSINLNEKKLKLYLDNEEAEEEEGKKNNITKMKLNVVNQNSQNNLVELRNFYKQRKLSQKINSWNVVNLANIPLLTNNNIPEEINLQKIDLDLDPMLISEEICIRLYLYLSKVKIENYDESNNNTEFFSDLTHSKEMNEIKNLILSLRSISLENLSKNPVHYYCFWLNMYNFLTVFSIIYLCESFSNSHEWNRFLKNSYFTIGNIVISLLEIEVFILRDKSIVDKIYGTKKYEQINLPKIPKYDTLINFGISMANNYSPSIRIYFPTNFDKSLKLNISEFFNRTIKLEDNQLKIPKYLSWIEPNFLENFDKYKMHLNDELVEYIETNKNNLTVIVEDFIWKLSFSNFKNSEINFW